MDELSVSMTTGNISANKVEANAASTTASTGKINVPSSGAGGLCTVRGGTGDVTFVISQ